VIYSLARTIADARRFLYYFFTAAAADGVGTPG
jgi:hypothetical protein